MVKSTVGSNKIYMDYASSAQPNPSSIHTLGVLAKNKLQNARLSVANVLSAKKSEIIFTSGGTESNNLAIQGVVLAWKEKSLPHIITTNIEHSSVLETFKFLEKRNLAEVSFINVETDGIVDPRKIKKEIKPNTILVSVMYANNEIGTIQPIKEIVKEIRHYKKQNKRNNIFFHTDAVQAVNYLDLNVDRLGVDMMTLSGSKIENSGRVGVLYKKSSVDIVPLFTGGNQEMGLRPGTENVPEILKFAKALQVVQSEKETEIKKLTKLRDYFLAKIIKMSKTVFDIEVIVNGSMDHRLPNNINITIPNIPSDLLVIELSARGVMASAKSACKEGDGKASYVISAINKNLKDTDGSVRFSFGRTTNKKEIDYTIKAFTQILQKLKKWYY